MLTFTNQIPLQKKTKVFLSFTFWRFLSSNLETINTQTAKQTLSLPEDLKSKHIRGMGDWEEEMEARTHSFSLQSARPSPLLSLGYDEHAWIFDLTPEEPVLQYMYLVKGKGLFDF